MILELGDGRELKLPDELSDEFARQLKALILTTEARAREAEERVSRIEQEFRSRPEPQPVDLSPILEALRVNHKEQMAALRAVVRAAEADRVMVMDELGEYSRSRIVK